MSHRQPPPGKQSRRRGGMSQVVCDRGCTNGDDGAGTGQAEVLGMVFGCRWDEVLRRCQGHSRVWVCMGWLGGGGRLGGGRWVVVQCSGTVQWWVVQWWLWAVVRWWVLYSQRAARPGLSHTLAHTPARLFGSGLITPVVLPARDLLAGWRALALQTPHYNLQVYWALQPYSNTSLTALSRVAW